jgi:putative oxidoreductase
MRYLSLPGRILFALIFILSGFSDFEARTIAYAASHGVPAAHVLVPLAGILALVGGLLIAVGFATRLGALLLVLFLVPVTLMMHNFWAVADPAMRQMQLINFLKNLGLLGGALVILTFGAGALSVDAWLVRQRLAHGRKVSRFLATPTAPVT